MAANTERAVLAGGCFWGMQELLRHHDGVITTRVGYTRGQNENPTDGNHPGHAEAVEVVFDPGRTSYRDILEFFFQIHDPTTRDRQGEDAGPEYRSEIFRTTSSAAPTVPPAISRGRAGSCRAATRRRAATARGGSASRSATATS
jgi:peptide-methionine (S)-S-oxide reductase